MGITTNKNFITANAVEAILMGKFFPHLNGYLQVTFNLSSSSEENRRERVGLYQERRFR